MTEKSICNDCIHKFCKYRGYLEIDKCDKFKAKEEKNVR